MFVLGVNECFHDDSSALVRDGEPIVRTPAEGLRAFEVTGMDYMAIGEFIVERGGHK